MTRVGHAQSTVFAGLVAVSMVGGCRGGSSLGTEDATGGAGGAASGAGGSGGGAAGSGGGAGAAGAAGSDARSGSVADGAGAGGRIPCAVEAVVRARCQGCHAMPMRFGAPMPLVAWPDFQAAAKSNPQKKVWELAKERLGAGTMPPATSPTGAPTADEKSTLLSWLNAGAPASTETACAAVPGVDGGPGAPVPAALPCTPAHTFRAQGADANTPYAVPVANNHYACFQIPVPFTGDEQAIAWGPLIDDARVVHHWILYDGKTTTRPNGCGSRDRIFLMGWAPGASNCVLPNDIGLELPNPGGWLILEVHYNNTAKIPDAKDRSGVAVCTTKQKRPKEAGVITFGQVTFAIPPGADNYEVRGECSPLATGSLREPLNVLGVWPHMHTLGTRFRTDLTSGGTTRALADVPTWDFNSQTGYPRDPAAWQIKPGDRVVTTCTYKNTTPNTVRFGERTEDEMCLNFTMIYPIAAVANLDRVPLRLCSF